MRRTRVKICGITRPDDGLAAVRLGADAIGLVFYPPSSRHVDMATAQRIVAALPPFVTVVGLFVDADAASVRDVLRQVPLQLLQFHGSEEPDYCASFALPFIKAVPMGAGADVARYANRFDAAALLLDSHGDQRSGGSGHTFDWARVPARVSKPIILAGGLKPDNVTTAIKQIRPFAVDVSSGVETAKGVKDSELMRAFMQGVDNGDSGAE